MPKATLTNVAIVLGSSARALDDLAAASRLVSDQSIICLNDSIKAGPVKPVAFCTIHSVGVPSRFIPPEMDVNGVKMFTHRRVHGFKSNVVRAKWQGTTGLYAVQIALDELGFDGVILAGVPMDAGAGTNYGRETWASDGFVASMRPAWLSALPAIGARVRSMSGWTKALLGEPTPEWLASLAPSSLSQGDNSSCL